ncbi:ferredoxin [Salinigranum rubrum]|uniref:Ferredoxin n=1 Tax=Salinigranum rubrum TaxID=755307 RepID=A0A2I8VMJ6_9EURY|nr:Rieske 2Fe-2S domain-containing protein [Salinigranum rubrum]AUV83141.1 ferredoxin [Salinigranum rubrum]
MSTSPPSTAHEVGPLDELREAGHAVVRVDGRAILVVAHEGEVFAVDNRCPHMGFPLARGTVDDGVLTCHWHHARFALSCGDTFDPWADDVPSYPVTVDDGVVYVDPHSREERPPAERWSERLDDGLERNLRLVVAKSVIGLLDAGVAPTDPLRTGVRFGTRYRADGWGPGLTILTAMANVLPDFSAEDRKRALYQGLVEVAADCAGEPPRFDQDAFDDRDLSPTRLAHWLRDTVEVRDNDGTERCLRTAVEAGYDDDALAGLLLTAATDHRYLDGGHTMDFVNKACEALDHVGWEHADEVLPSLVTSLTDATRSEELSSWRQPVDLAARLDEAFDRLDDLVAEGAGQEWVEPDDFVQTLLADDHERVVGVLEDAIAAGASPVDLADAVAMAAATRVAQFSTANEFSDWNTVHHTYTYSNAVHALAERVSGADHAAYRAVFDGAVNVYLDRFLNSPPAAIPERGGERDVDDLLDALDETMDREGRVDEAGRLAAHVFDSGGADRLKRRLGAALVREDAGFHTFQALEAGFAQADRREGTERRTCLVAVARYLAAHAPTRREREQTFTIAARLHRGEAIHEE